MKRFLHICRWVPNIWTTASGDVTLFFFGVIRDTCYIEQEMGMEIYRDKSLSVSEIHDIIYHILPVLQMEYPKRYQI